MANPTLGSNVTRSIAATASYIQQKWTREIQQPFDKILQIAPLVQDRSGLVADGGNILNVPFVQIVNSRAKVGGTGVTYDSPDGAPVVLNVDQHYYVAVLIEDIAKIQASYDLKSAFYTRMAEALARQVDTTLMNQYTNSGVQVSAGAAASDASIISVVAAFDNGNTPQSLRRGVIGNNTKADLLGINKYVAYDQTGERGKAIDGTDGLQGSIYGMDLYHSGNVTTATTGRNLFFHKNAITLMKQQPPKFEMEYSVDQIGWKTVLHTVFGTGVERPGSVIELDRTTAP